MGNCQAIDAAALTIQHPCGKVDKFYWPVSACEIMRLNPGHYVALLISTTLCPTSNNSSTANKDKQDSSNNNNNNGSGNTNSVRLTRIKLLRPTDTLILGQVYRLITTQDVVKGLSAKKHAKMDRSREPSADQKPERINEKPKRSELEKNNQVMKHERRRPRTATASTNSAAAKTRIWQPSLNSISEAGS